MSSNRHKITKKDRGEEVGKKKEGILAQNASEEGQRKMKNEGNLHKCRKNREEGIWHKNKEGEEKKIDIKTKSEEEGSAQNMLA